MKKLVSSVLAAVLFVSMLTICAFSADIAKTITIEVGTTIELELNLVGIKDYGGLGIHTTGDIDAISKGIPNGTLLKITGIKEGTCVLKATSSKTGATMCEYTINVAVPKADVKVNFGGSGWDDFNSVIATEDGYVAVGSSNGGSFGNGDWIGVSGKGETDAIIVKYDKSGNVIWKKNFGGSSSDVFNSVIATEDGYVAVGLSVFYSFGNGDWSGGVSGKRGIDAIIVKYDKNGNVIWKSSFGGGSDDKFFSVTEGVDGYVAVGYSYSGSFGNGDWNGVSGKGGIDAIIVKYDKSGNVIWKKNFGGSVWDYFYSVIATEDGYVAVGYSDSGSFGNGDWANVSGKGLDDAIIVKYDKSGNVIWKKNFGGSDYDRFFSVTATEDGYVAVGHSLFDSFGNGDWNGISSKGGIDAIIVKYDKSGNVIWKKNFGGRDYNRFNSVTATEDGYVAVGYSNSGSFGNGDWMGVSGKGKIDAIIVKYDKSGSVVWKSNFGGNDSDYFNSVTATEDGYVAVGCSSNSSFDDGDWMGVSGKGSNDAILVKYTYSTTATSTTNTTTITSNTATLPKFKVTMNGVTVDNTYLKYPFIVCNDITYFPMTYNDSRFLGIGTSYTPETGLAIARLSKPSGKYNGEKGTDANPDTFDVTLATGKITVNGKSINNFTEEYPLLLFRDITYFPMTWRFCVDEFGWSYSFDDVNGLVIKTN